MFGINIVRPVDMDVRRGLESTTGSNHIIDAIGFSIGDFGKFQVLRNLFKVDYLGVFNMVSKFELKRSAFISFVGMLALLIIAGAEWAAADQYGLLMSEDIIYYLAIIVQLVLVWFAFVFSLVFFGCLTEYMGREPGIITLAFAYIPILLYLAVLGTLERFIYAFVALSVLAILYVLYSE